MSEVTQRVNAYAIWVGAMAQALGRRDEAGFRAALAGFDAVRDIELLTGVRKVTLDLQAALDRFSADSRLLELAERQVPDARQRLAHVLRLTDDAAHRTMDLVERCCPLADQTAREAEHLVGAERSGHSSSQSPQALSLPVTTFLQQTVVNMSAVRGNLAEVLVAQGYQDLSGQIIRGVMALVDQLEGALRELVFITGATQATPVEAIHDTRGAGPVIPGINCGNVMGGQPDIDALLSDLGI